MDTQITPETIHVIKDEGMPILNERTKGNLYIKFDIQFPKMDTATKQSIVQIIRKNAEETDDLENE